MLIEIEPPMPAPGPFDSIYRHTLYRNMLAAVEDLGAAWHNVIDDNVDVGDPADRHIAAARLLRMLCSRHRRIYGHALPVTVLPCSVAVLHNCVDIRWDDGDHLLLVTGRAVADLGLAARCPITPIPTLVIERPLGWADTAEFLMVRTDDVTITYVAHDRHTYRRNELWRRTNAAWSDVAERVQREYDRLFAERLRRDWEGGRPRTGVGGHRNLPTGGHYELPVGGHRRREQSLVAIVGAGGRVLDRHFRYALPSGSTARSGTPSPP